jgi:hypothetical protein
MHFLHTHVRTYTHYRNTRTLPAPIHFPLHWRDERKTRTWLAAPHTDNGVNGGLTPAPLIGEVRKLRRYVVPRCKVHVCTTSEYGTV